MLPAGYTGLLYCDPRRAAQWQRGLRRAGFDVAVADSADDDKGECEVGVVTSQAREAKAFVGEVIRGARRLPLSPALSATGFRALVAIGLVIAALVAVGILAARP
jgi:hypothetical protein